MVIFWYGLQHPIFLAVRLGVFAIKNTICLGCICIDHDIDGHRVHPDSAVKDPFMNYPTSLNFEHWVEVDRHLVH